ncbi:MAG: hypothetical protein AAGE52_01180 [Myxococcota bacterium]
MSAPSKLTKKLVERVEKEIKEGAGYHDAVRIQGISKRTAARWRKIGRLDIEAGRMTTLHARICIAADKVEGERVKEARQAIRRRIKDTDHDKPELSLKAATWFLERKEREEFGARVEVEVRERLQERIQYARERMSRGAYLEMIQAFAEFDGIEDEMGEVLRSGDSLGEGEPSSGSGGLH